MSEDRVQGDDCWTRGGSRLVCQACAACGRRWLFRRGFCPHCGAGAPQWQALAGRGRVAALTVVHRAPDEGWRTIAPYRLVLVDLDEGLRLMAHADAGVAVGDRVRGEVRLIAGRRLPCFARDDGG